MEVEEGCVDDRVISHTEELTKSESECDGEIKYSG